MKKDLKRHRGERLADWIDRLAPACQGRTLAEVHDILHDLSVASYIEGTHAQQEIDSKHSLLRTL